jgi:hypothetical protein
MEEKEKMKLRDKIYKRLLKLIEDNFIPEGKNTEKCADHFEALFQKEMKEVIGEDEDINKIEDGYDLAMAEGANQLRAKLRKKANL